MQNFVLICGDFTRKYPVFASNRHISLRLKNGYSIIDKTNNISLFLDFFVKIGFNSITNTPHPDVLQLHIWWTNHTGDLHWQSRRDKWRNLPWRHEYLRHRDCMLTQLWKAKAPTEQPAMRGISQVYIQGEAIRMGFLFGLPCFFIRTPERNNHETRTQLQNHHQ